MSKAGIVVLLLAFNGCLQGQNNPSISSGTLNLVLANKHGAVIATDSRSSRGWPCRYHEDDSVKLFKTTEKSAMAIAGFAASSLDIPFGMRVAGVIGRHFDPAYNQAPEEVAVFLEDWLDVQIFPDIEALAAFLEARSGITAFGRGLPPTGSDYTFIATTVDTFKGTPHISQFKLQVDRYGKFQTNGYTKGPLGNYYPSFEIRRHETTVEHFVYEYAGISNFVEPILRGAASDDDPSVRKYLASLKNHTADDLTLHDLDTLAHRLLSITSDNTQCVGGADQIAVLPSSGKSSWHLRDTKALAGSLEGRGFAVGLTFHAGKSDKQTRLVFPDKVSAYNQWSYVMIDNRINDSKVLLDGNSFLGDLFVNPVFLWYGGRFQFDRNKIEGSCIFKVWAKASDEKIPEALRKCKREKAPAKLPLGTVGSPYRLGVRSLSSILGQDK